MPEFVPVDLNTATPYWWKVFEPSASRAFEAADLYCGCGGGTQAIIESVMRRGGHIRKMIAGNHWDAAIQVHSANYPQVAHFLNSVENVEPKLAVPNGHLDILTAGIKCTHHSRAAGGVPRSEQERMDAFQVLRWLHDLDVSRLVIENVPEFLEWGPLNQEGRPIERLKGKLFVQWIGMLEALNYKVQWKVLTACWYGDPTSRERFWLIAKKGNRKVFFPEATHRDPNQPATVDMFRPELPPWPVARDIIDFELPTRSIFGSDLVPNTLSRILAGLHRFAGIRLKVAELPGCPEFKARKTGKGEKIRVSPYAVDAHRLHYLNLAIRAAQDHPIAVKNRRYVTKVNPKAVDMVRRLQQAGPPNEETAAAYMIKMYGESHSASIDEALPTVVGGSHLGFVLVNRGGQDGYDRNHSLDETMPTLTTENPIGVVDFLLQQQSGGVARSVEQPVPALATDGAVRLVNVIMPSEGYYRGNGARPDDQPLPSLTRRGAGLVSYLVSGHHYNGRDRIASSEVAMPTLTTRPDWSVINTFLAIQHGTNSGNDRTASVDKALPTIDTTNRYMAAFLALAYGTERDGQGVDEALRTVTGKDRFMLVLPGLGFLDIRYRMLALKELAKAHSVPAGFTFEGVTNEAGKKMIGNMWPIRMGTAVVDAALTERGEK